MKSGMTKTETDISKALYERHAEMCKVFSNATRIFILDILRDEELSVAAIAAKSGIALGTISPHLLMMKQRRVLLSRKVGNQVFYRLSDSKILRSFDLIREMLFEQMVQEGQLASEFRDARLVSHSSFTA